MIVNCCVFRIVHATSSYQRAANISPGALNNLLIEIVSIIIADRNEVSIQTVNVSLFVLVLNVFATFFESYIFLPAVLRG